jgi:hypothetical protein
VTAVEQALLLGPTTSRNRYNAARVFAQASFRAAEDRPLQRGADRDLCLQYQDRAVALLRDAMAALPDGERTAFWSETIRRDGALNPIRTCTGFRKLAAEFAGAAPDR